MVVEEGAEIAVHYSHECSGKGSESSFQNRPHALLQKGERSTEYEKCSNSEHASLRTCIKVVSTVPNTYVERVQFQSARRFLDRQSAIGRLMKFMLLAFDVDWEHSHVFGIDQRTFIEEVLEAPDVEYIDKGYSSFDEKGFP